MFQDYVVGGVEANLFVAGIRRRSHILSGRITIRNSGIC